MSRCLKILILHIASDCFFPIQCRSCGCVERPLNPILFHFSLQKRLLWIKETGKLLGPSHSLILEVTSNPSFNVERLALQVKLHHCVDHPPVTSIALNSHFILLQNNVLNWTSLAWIGCECNRFIADTI